MDISLKKALRKAKFKQLLVMIITSIIIMMVLLFLFNRVGNYFAAKSTFKLHDILFLHNAIMEPNIQIDSQVTSNSSMFGGNIVTNRSKNINGYLVQWSTLTSSYDWFGAQIDHNELVPGFHWSDREFYEYDKQTKTKAATFYHPLIQKYYKDVPNELKGLSELKNHVAEVAISFDQPYTFGEIRNKLPANVNVVWFYMTSSIGDESSGPSGMPVYGFADSTDEPASGYENFIANLEKYDVDGDDETIQEFLKINKSKSFNDVEILGVMLTGKTESFKPLENEGFIRGASVGATAQIVPYIKPDK